ncbi:Zona pellucida domain-containing protein [Aphelenchoides fujianensis]|nr:Zona pellucida domain-containing protein [Aphelenchoides fujianensis]
MPRRPLAAAWWLLFGCFVRWGAAVRLLDTSVSCDQSNFILLLNFDSPFRGIVYSEDGYPNCLYINGSMIARQQYQLKAGIPLVGCETKMNEEGNFENAIIVQDNAKFLQSSDKKYLLTCIPSTMAVGPQRESLITVDFGGVTVDNSHTTSEVISNTLPAGTGNPALKYNVEIHSGHSVESPTLTNALNIGDPISYVVRLQKPVADSQISRCWASDTSSNLELSDERGCSVQPRGNIWGAFEKIESAEEVVFINRIKAWAFPTSNEVNIFCNLRICMSRSCAFSNCSLPADTRRAKRHEASGDLAEVETVTTKLRFRRQAMPSVSATDLLTTSTDEPNRSKLVCLTTSHLALLAACVFAVLLLVILVVFLLAPHRLLGNLRS